MTDTPLEELISAYLDGELTGAEQTRIEQMLETDAAARLLADELRALSSTLQALPQHRLTEDLSAGVLAQALTAAQASAAPVIVDGNGAQAADRPSVLPLQQEPEDDASQTEPHAPPTTSAWRGLIWAAMAIAASVMLVLFNTETQDPELARNDEAAEGFAASGPVAGEKAQQNSRVAGSRENTDAFATAAGPAEESQVLAAELHKSAEPLKSRAAKAMSATEGEESAPALKFADSESSSNRKSLVAGGGRSSFAGKAGNIPADAAVDTAAPAFSAPTANSLQLQMVDEATVVADRLVASEPLSDFDGAFFVQVNIKASAAKSGAFGKLLASENIVWEESAQDKRSLVPQDPSEKQDGQSEDSKLAQESFARKKEQSRAERIRQSELGESDDAVENAVEVVVVDASSEQIERTLAQIEQRTGEYAGFDIEPVQPPAMRQLAENYEFAAPAEGAPISLGDDLSAAKKPAATKNSSRPTVETPPPADSPRGAAPEAEEAPLADGIAPQASETKAATGSTLETEKAKTAHAVGGSKTKPKDATAMQRFELEDRAVYRDSQSRARRYYVQADDLPVQSQPQPQLHVRSQSSSVVRGDLDRQSSTPAARPTPDEPRSAARMQRSVAPPANRSFQSDVKQAEPAPASAKAESSQAAPVAVAQAGGRAAPLNESEGRPRDQQLQQPPGGETLVRQSRAYFVLRIVPDNVSAATSSPAEHADAPVEAAAEELPVEGTPPEP